MPNNTTTQQCITGKKNVTHNDTKQYQITNITQHNINKYKT